MALYIPQSILHLARSLYVRPETYGPNYVPQFLLSSEENCKMVNKSGTVSAKLCSLQRIFCV